MCGAERSFWEAERFRQDVMGMKINVSVILLSLFPVSTCTLAKISLQNLKQAMALDRGGKADAAAGRCKWSMVQAAAWCQFVLPPSQAQQPSRGASPHLDGR